MRYSDCAACNADAPGCAGIIMLMKALQVVSPRCFVQIEIEKPTLPKGSEGQVIVRPSWVSMCGSDIPFFTGTKRHKTYPLLPGAPIHECVGEVIESSSALFKPGDRVLSIPNGDQGLADYFVAQATKTIPLPSEIADPGAACIIQPLSTVINAMDRLGDINGKSVAVMGLGSIGLMFCMLAARAGAKSVIGIDPCENRCEAAMEAGAVMTSCCSGIEFVHDARGKSNGPDIIIEAVGHQMNTINDCLEIVKYRGTVLAFGVPDHLVYAFEYETFFRKNAHLIACVTPDWAGYLPRAFDFYRENQEELSRLITHRLAIRDAETAFSLYERHEDGIIKAAINAEEW
jgi:L-iditol 2-dehydrogenase